MGLNNLADSVAGGGDNDYQLFHSDIESQVTTHKTPFDIEN